MTQVNTPSAVPDVLGPRLAMVFRSIPLYLRSGCALTLLFAPIPVAVTR